MGFDDSRTPEFRIPVSDTQAYRQFGNSVVVPVIKEIAQMMLPHIGCQLSNEKLTEENRIAV
jgi:DNA (cytosine-5)-methyltransferase 1